MPTHALLALVLLTQAAPVSPGYPPAGHYRHGCKIEELHDKLGDAWTTLGLELGSVARNGFHTVEIEVTRWMNGRVRGKGDVSLILVSKNPDGWRYRDSRQVVFDVDGERWTYESRFNESGGEGGYREGCSVILTEERFLKLVNAKSVEGKIGTDQLSFMPRQREALRDFASYLDNPALPIVNRTASFPAPEARSIPPGQAVLWNPDSKLPVAIVTSKGVLDEHDRVRASESESILAFAERYVRSGEWVAVESETPVKISESVDRPGSKFAKRIYRVEVLAGPRKGLVGWCNAESVIAGPPSPAQLAADAERVRAAEARQRAAAQEVSNKRAGTKLVSAKNLEKSGRMKAAIEYYTEIVRDFGTTPAAEEARARLKALGK